MLDNMASLPKILITGQKRFITGTFHDLLLTSRDFVVEVTEHLSQMQTSPINSFSAVIVFVEEVVELEFLTRNSPTIPPTILILSEEQNAQLPSQYQKQNRMVVFPKPFSFQEVLIQLQGMVTRYEIKRQVTFKLGDIVIDPSSLMLINASEETVKLTQKEFDLLYVLYKARGETLSREYLLKEVWGYNRNIITNTLDTHIHWLRQKIETDSASPQIIVTVNGGYQITPELPSSNQ